MPYVRIAILILCFSGCGKSEPANNGTANVNKVDVPAEKHWYTPWRQSEEERKAEEEEKARIIAENKERLKNELSEADDLLDEWSDKLDQKETIGNGFVHHEGRTELDPWGNLLKVDYHQLNLKEYMVIRSLGPDGQQDTEDDLVRKRYAMNYPGMFEGLDGLGQLVLSWTICGIVSFFLFSGYAYSGKRRNHHKHSPLGMAGALIYCVVLAPIAVVTYGISLVASVMDLDFDMDPFDMDV